MSGEVHPELVFLRLNANKPLPSKKSGKEIPFAENCSSEADFAISINGSPKRGSGPVQSVTTSLTRVPWRLPRANLLAVWDYRRLTSTACRCRFGSSEPLVSAVPQALPHQLQFVTWLEHSGATSRARRHGFPPVPMPAQATAFRAASVSSVPPSLRAACIHCASTDGAWNSPPMRVPPLALGADLVGGDPAAPR